MTSILLFGASTPSGASFIKLVGDSPLIIAGRKDLFSTEASKYCFCDLEGSVDCLLTCLPNTPIIMVSFAPIWHLATFIDKLSSCHPEYFRNFKGMVVCSSSSVVTKRYASNNYDRKLVSMLLVAEETLKSISATFCIPCTILAPTLIYGSCSGFTDRNLSVVHSWLKICPLIPLPHRTGTRQPIHCTQLADVAYQIINSYIHAYSSPREVEYIVLGGDETLTYAQMLRRIRDISPSANKHKTLPRLFRSRFIYLPNRLFNMLAFPLILFSPKAFEAILRISADLSGFTEASKLTSSQPLRFPVTSSFV